MPAPVEDGLEDLVPLDPGGQLGPLHGGQPAQDHLLHPILEGRISVQPQGVGEADHGGFGHAHGLAQLGGGHKGRLLVAGGDEVGDALLALGQARQPLLDLVEQIVHGHMPFNGAVMVSSSAPVRGTAQS